MFSIFTRFADLVTYKLFHLEQGTHLSEAIHFFIEDVTKIFILLICMIYIISFLRAGVNADRIRNFLSGKRKIFGYALAALFGAITPFCSCSSIPLFLGFTSAGIPLGFTMAFLITSPMINEVAVVLLGSVVGLEFTIVYIITGISAGILGGIFIDLIKAEKYLTIISLKAMENRTIVNGAGAVKLTFRDRHRFAVDELKSILKRVWLWVFIGVGIGALIHGLLPAGFISDNLGDGQWWTVPAAVVLGIPLYANASGVIPVIESLLNKGLPIGTGIALMMSIVGASFPEFILLKQVMKAKLLLIFFTMLFVFFTLAGWLFNIIF